MYAVKMVIGRDESGTTYDEENALRFEKPREAISEAGKITPRATFDIINEDHGERIARVHVDGGIDYAPGTAGLQF